MDNPTSILQLNEKQLDNLINELTPVDANIGKKVDYVMNNANLDKANALEYVVASSPVLWARVYLNWEARDYQEDILAQGKKAKKLVLRLGRRLGKTECMCILILWHAYTQINKGTNGQYDVLIVTPFETQVDLIFDRLHQLIDGSPVLKASVTRDVYHRIEFANGSKITGLTAGSKSGNGAANTRGQAADFIILDEVDYMGSDEITNIINIRNEAPDRIKVMTASTPCGKHEEFYRWCTAASHRFAPSQKDIDEFTFTKYINTENADGNGWTEVYAPSIVNKELLKINSDTGISYLEELKLELSEMRFVQEVMAMFGEEEMGVYQKKYIEKAVEEGRRIEYRYTTEMEDDELVEFLSKRRLGPRILGVDWDKYAASTNMACIELDTLHRNSLGQLEPKFKVLFRIEIPRSDFTYTNAVSKIIELNDTYDFDWISIDRGYGETQLEMLHKYGMENPITGLHEKTIGYQFAQKLEVRDPYTHVKDKKPLKPFMVNNSVIVFEKEKIILNPSDKLVIQQFEQYRVESISKNGIPTYCDKNEHIVDAINLALLAFEQKYGELMKNIVSSKILLIDGIDRPDRTKSRDMESKKSNIHSLVKMGNSTGYVKERVEQRQSSRPTKFSRRSF